VACYYLLVCAGSAVLAPSAKASGFACVFLCGECLSDVKRKGSARVDEGLAQPMRMQ